MGDMGTLVQPGLPQLLGGQGKMVMLGSEHLPSYGQVLAASSPVPAGKMLLAF